MVFGSVFQYFSFNYLLLIFIHKNCITVAILKDAHYIILRENYGNYKQNTLTIWSIIQLVHARSVNSENHAPRYNEQHIVLLDEAGRRRAMVH